MKRYLALALVALAACAPRATTARGGGEVGAVAPRVAVDRFMAAARQQDLQGMTELWGTRKGPAREQMSRNEVEKRVVVMQICLAHDQIRVGNESRPAEDARVYRVELARGAHRRETNVFTVQGPGGRWFVENIELELVKDFCEQP